MNFLVEIRDSVRYDALLASRPSSTTVVSRSRGIEIMYKVHTEGEGIFTIIPQDGGTVTIEANDFSHTASVSASPDEIRNLIDVLTMALDNIGERERDTFGQ